MEEVRTRAVGTDNGKKIKPLCAFRRALGSKQGKIQSKADSCCRCIQPLLKKHTRRPMSSPRCFHLGQNFSLCCGVEEREPHRFLLFRGLHSRLAAEGEGLWPRDHE